MRMRKMGCLLVSVFALAGCQTTVNFLSDIEGAEVTTSNGAYYGKTPVSITFDNDALDTTRQIDGCARIPGVTYTWASGAKVASTDPILLCGDEAHYQVYLKRPEDAPDRDKDLQMALEAQRTRAAALQLELERERLYRDPFWGMPGGWIMLTPPPPRHHHRPPPPRRHR